MTRQFVSSRVSFSMKHFFWVLCLFPYWITAQVATDIPTEIQAIIEDFVSDQEDATFDFNTLLENLEIFLEQPIDLNEADESLLRELHLLTDRQIDELLKYRRTAGKFIALYELQAIPGFDLNAVRRILPFVTIKGDTFDYNLSVLKMMRDGDNLLYLKWNTILEEQKGYAPRAPGEEDENRYLGDKNQYYVRYKHAYGYKLSYGFTAEKDRGEEFFTGSNKKGFDFYSAHFYLRDYSRLIKAIAIGDYGVSLGQGLIIYSGYSSGKSMFVTNIRRGGRVLRPYSSVNESAYFRGAAATLGVVKNLAITTFASYRNRDANFIESSDTLATEEAFSAINLTGFHRTESELKNRNSAQQTSFGGSIKWKGKAGRHIALNTVYHRFSHPLNRKIKPYNQFSFNGQELLDVSLDYAFLLRNLSFFGETAMSDNGAIATVNGLQLGLNRNVDFAILHRFFPRDYQALNASPFSETRGAANESGIYLGMEVRATRHIKVAAYYDLWRHPWLRYNAAAPSRGREYRARITYHKKRTYECYLEFKNEVKQINQKNELFKTNALVDKHTFQGRLHFAFKLTKELELRSRIDAGFADVGTEKRKKGAVVYQDILYKPLEFPLSITARFALFDTDGFDTRYYSYENDLLYTFSIPAYYNVGSRAYINLRYRGIRHLVLEGRIAQLYWSNKDKIGSGLEAINGHTKTQVSLQVKVKF